RGPQARLHGTDDSERDLVLEGEDIVKRTIVSFGPEMDTGFRLYELTGDTHSVGALANATLQHVTDAEFTADLFHVDRATPVDEARVPRDDEQPFNARQASDDVLDHAVAKIILLRIAAHILEWEHGD